MIRTMPKRLASWLAKVLFPTPVVPPMRMMTGRSRKPG